MSYQERRAIVSFISTILISTLYSAYMLQRYPDGGAYSPEVFSYWATFFILLIPVSIAAKIIIHIVFSIINTITSNEGEPSLTDERDKLIDLKSTRNALYTFVAGFFLAIGSAAADAPPTIMFILLLGAGILSQIVADISQFFFYRRGF